MLGDVQSRLMIISKCVRTLIMSQDKQFNLRITKLETFGPTSNLIDRVVKAVFADVENRIDTQTVLVVPALGADAVKVACIAVAKGYPLVIFTPDDIGQEWRTVLTAYGADVHYTNVVEGLNSAVRRVTEARLGMINSVVLDIYCSHLHVDTHLHEDD